MQIETTRKYYLTPVKMAISQGEKKRWREHREESPAILLAGV